MISMPPMLAHRGTRFRKQLQIDENSDENSASESASERVFTE
jgi:hypothetical protein